MQPEGGEGKTNRQKEEKEKENRRRAPPRGEGTSLSDVGGGGESKTSLRKEGGEKTEVKKTRQTSLHKHLGN